ncbi:hypothetical protein B296_00026591 [Ensete ventricosum]|uniref:Uncharacterized protein n=1 Tax=Ensete ventricosum TaxID=4639 RepID=A0A426ZN95_ENSVE|nr:hypothetical protein B296_00026591 [Ensete ventricosum]
MSCRSIMSLFDANKQAKQATNLGVSFALLLSQDRRWDAADAAARLTIVTKHAALTSRPHERLHLSLSLACAAAAAAAAAALRSM